MKNKIDLSNVIVIIWWAFQWKSLISLKLASKLKYSWVISTDYIRNFLRIENKNPIINISTSRMDQEIFEKQREIISSFLLNYIKFYIDRKEKIILEWMHFSKDFLLFLKNNWAKCFWLNNELDWYEKVKLKTITTPTIKIIHDNKEEILEYSEKINIEDILYIQQKEYYEKFHNILLNDLKDVDIKIINYFNIYKWIKKIMKIIYKKSI